MEYNKYIYELSERVAQFRDHCATEEATKTALILPFLSALGYDTANPLEVMPEAPCAIKGFDRIDYILSADGEYRMLVECKHWRENLDNHVKQLEQYFQAAIKPYGTQIGLLTNGIEYRFFADTDRPNIMDDIPFFVFDISQPTDKAIERLKMFRRNEFDIHFILATAMRLSLSAKLHSVVEHELTSPSDEFVNFLWGRMSTGKKLTKYQRDLFTPMVKEEVTDFTMTRINHAIDNVLNLPKSKPPKSAEDSASLPSDVQEALSLVRSILSKLIEPNRITAEPRSNNYYYAIRLDGNKWRKICTIRLTESTKWIIVSRFWVPSRKFYTSHQFRHDLNSVSDITNFSQEIIDVATVMLLPTNEERIAWVNANHQDWLQ